MALLLEQFPPAAGVLLAWSLAAPPGPANALIAHVAAQRGFGAGWMTGMGAVAGDVLMFTLMWLGALRVVDAYPPIRVGMAVVGAALMTFFAWEAFRTARRLAIARRRSAVDAGAAAPDAADVGARGGFTRSFVAVTTSPFNWVWWLSVGAGLFATLGWGVVIGFFAGLTAWCAFWSGLARYGVTRFRAFREIVAATSAVVLVAFAVIIAAFGFLTARSLWW